MGQAVSVITTSSGKNKKARGRAKRLPCFKLMKVEDFDDADGPEVLVATTMQATFLAQNELPDAKIQCGCCCFDSSFESMVQCADGHLFCFNCLRRCIEESTFGSLPACGPVACMDMAGCNKSIPWSEIHRAIEADLVVKFEHRQASDSLVRAKLQGLVYCPFCDVACEVASRLSTFTCPNEACGKASCMKCREPFHEPLRCEEVEKRAQTQVRHEVEEVMSSSLIRECTACNAQLVKDGGCNKLTCRCGQCICYVCRQPIINYRHFCEHFRRGNDPCHMCKKCSLWDKEDEATVVTNAKKAKMKSKEKENPDIWHRAIGPAESMFKSKRRKT